MPTDAVVILIAVTGAFALFAVVLMWADFQTRGMSK
jgi:hypothetical protein